MHSDATLTARARIAAAVILAAGTGILAAPHAGVLVAVVALLAALGTGGLDREWVTARGANAAFWGAFAATAAVAALGCVASIRGA